MDMVVCTAPARPSRSQRRCAHPADCSRILNLHGQQRPVRVVHEVASAEHRYKNLPKISRGTMLPDATVVAAQRVPNGRRDNMVWMIKTADGLVYGFQQPNHAAKFALQQGVELNLHFNTTKWTME